MPKSVDEIIREAMERGDFSDLPNKGKKLDLTDYFDTPDELRVGFSLLKNANIPPEEVRLLNEISEFKEKLTAISDEPKRKRLLKEIEDRRLKYNLLMDRSKRHR